MLAWILAAFVAACSTSLLFTWIVRKTAPRIRLMDYPDGRRKLHQRPTPLGGGIAIYLTTATMVAAIWFVPSPLRSELQANPAALWSLLAAAAVIVLVGTLDDLVGLRGRQKLVGQIAAASILIASGLLIKRVEIFNQSLELGLLAVPVTLIWLLGAVNAVNLLDGVDGLATVLGIILSGTIGLIAAVTGHTSVAILGLVFTGTLVGFLRFNFPPASVFLGDAGSMIIGLVVGVIAIHGSLKGPGTVLLAAPVAVLTIPIFDSAVAILRRKLTGRSIYTTDRGHLHHQLLSRMGSNRKVVGFLALCCVLTCAAAFASATLKNDLVALFTFLGMTAIFVVTGMFGRGEFALLAGRLQGVARSLVLPANGARRKVSQTTVRLQGSQPWDLLWTTLVEAADRLALHRICLDLNLPMAHEGFHATWERHPDKDSEYHWQVEIPLMIDSHPVGHVTVGGGANGRPVCMELEQLVDLLMPFESRLQALTANDDDAEPAGGGDGDLSDHAAAVFAAKHPGAN
jgi:UDP-GlcNAc:undecaprenyl-phosphate GlcNAc-1-phosphate transferase